MTTKTELWSVYGSELSPFTLKLLLLCRNAGLAHRFLPVEGGVLENLQLQHRLRKLKQGRLPLSWPVMTADDEFPLVPFLFGPQRENLYDSSAIAYWLDQQIAEPVRRVIPDDPAAAFITRLIDDYADEFGLYMVHHNRWKVSARDNNAGQRVAREMLGPFEPLQKPFGAWFSARQVRRLPYLFSVAPPGYQIDGLARRLQPPTRLGFPASHALLETAFARLLDCLEVLLAKRPFVLGGHFTLADAALYGELAMNLDDPSAARLIRERAPRVEAWLRQLRYGDLPNGDGKLLLDQELSPLLAEICRTHVRLMQQNLAAFEDWQARGESCFNEAAFDQHRALYDGELEGQAFRHVAKSFQAKVWRECTSQWARLAPAERAALEDLLPPEHGLDQARREVQLVA